MSFLFAALVAATPVAASPIVFDELNSDTIAASTEKLKCRTTSQMQFCRLSRTEVAGIPFSDSLVLTNDDGKIKSIWIRWDDTIFDRPLVEALTIKYGQPNTDKESGQTNKNGGPYKARTVEWKNFSDGDILLVRSENDVSFVVSFSVNRPAAKPPKVNF